jgi:tetratricopeptide (TPR) repeat protein
MLSRACYEQRQYSAARNALVNAVLRDESEVGNLVLLARVDLRLNKPGEARQAAERAVGLEPSNAAAHAELGLALALLDDVRGGLKELDVAQRLSRNLLPEANRNRAVVLAHEGKLELARDELKQAIITRPTDVDFKIELGDIYVVLDNLDLAKVEYTQARELAPQRPETHYKVALAAKKQGDALKKDGKDDLAKKAYEEALENAKNALSKDDQFTPAYGLQADLLRLLGRTDDARKVLDRGVKVRGEDPRMQEFVQQQAALDEAAKAAEEEAARRTEAAKNPPPPTETSTKKTAPVIEEPENSEPTPIQVPGPR